MATDMNRLLDQFDPGHGLTLAPLWLGEALKDSEVFELCDLLHQPATSLYRPGSPTNHLSIRQRQQSPVPASEAVTSRAVITPPVAFNTAAL